MCDDLYRILYQEAHKFLMQRSGINGVHDVTSSCVAPQINNLKIICRHLLEALLNTKGIKAAVGDIDALEQALFQFDPKKIHGRYRDDGEALFKAIRQMQNKESMDADHEGYLSLFCKGALNAADLLSQMGSVKGFKRFVDGFYYNEMTQAVLPLLMQMEVGLTFQAACLFLDRIGYADYVCPDQKVKALWQDIGFIESRDHYEALKALISISRACTKTPFEVHLLFFMIATEKLPEKDLKGQMRQPFIDHIIPIITKYI